MDPDRIADVTRRSFIGGIGVSAAAQTLNAAPAGKKVKIGIVGGGFGSSFQWHMHPNCSVTAVCDIRPDRLQRLSEVYRCSNTYKNYREFLKHPEAWVDGDLMATPGKFDPIPAWLGENLPLIFYASTLGMLALHVLGWRWTYAWRHGGRLLALATIFIPLPYILSHAEGLVGPRLPLDGVLLTFAAFALACLIPGVGAPLAVRPVPDATSVPPPFTR